MPRRLNEEYVPDWLPEQTGKRPLTRSEQPIVTDGQLRDAIDRGPERRNPEGSVDISNEDYRER